MYFLDKRVQVIADQLKNLRTLDSCGLSDWQYKYGFFLHPEEADADPHPWENFDCSSMRWYATYDGSDQVEGKFKGYTGDFHGIHGEHYWFRKTFTVPENMDGQSVWLHISTQIEEWDDAKNPQFLVFVNGRVTQGADMNHRDVLLFSHARGGEAVTLDIQAYTGTMHQEFCFVTSLFVLDEKINALYYDLQIPLWTFGRLDPDSQTRLKVQTVLNDAVNLIDMRTPYSQNFYRSLEQAQACLAENLYHKLCGNEDVIASCIGHTHIDIAWWWTVEQTREKAVRSFSTVLKLMEEYPDYKFMSSQPILYAFVKERYPDVFQRIKERVAEGRWETEGGMWLEADCNLTSGESLVRQFIYGKRFFREEFNQDNRILWLPDVFGYSAALPQILKKCGIDYFMTTKLSWNQINKIPNDTFLWKGIDGTDVLTHMITATGENQDPKQEFITSYSANLHPGALAGGWERYQNKDINNDILICYGHGDGGGGPTRTMLETSKRMELGLPGMPKVRQCFSRDYFEKLEKTVSGNPRLETWEGELYFERHRGTYTSMARNKRSNRKSEFLMMDLELLGVLAAPQLPYPTEADTRLWRDIVLRNQFHDILPGSSIAEVYEVTKKEYEALAEEAGGLIRQRLELLAGAGDGVTVFNTLGFARSDVVNLGAVAADGLKDESGRIYPVQQTADGAVVYLENLPSKGYKTLEAVKTSAVSAFARRDDRHLETPFYSIILDENGHMASIFDKENDRELVQEGQCANRMRLYEDKPIYFDNWDIEDYYTEKFWDVSDLVSLRWTEDGAVRTTLELEYNCNASKIWQKIHFYANSRRIDFETNVDWKEHQHLLKVEFPVDIHADEAAFEIQFGNVTRKVHKNTSWDKARFETCAHKWMDFSEGHYGVSLLNDCKYGHSVNKGVIGLTLIKCGVEPNPNTDVEMHTFTYALYPHAGTWQEAGTVQEAYKLNQNAYALVGGQPGTCRSFASVNASNVILETVKQAEDGNGTVLRLYETENARTKTILTLPAGAEKAYSTNLLEEIEEELPIIDGKVTFLTKPYEIKTILVR